MSEPERLLNGEASAFERELLGAVASERPARGLSRRMRQGLVASGVLASAKVGMASALLIAGLVTSGIGLGVYALTTRPTEAPARAPMPVELPASRPLEPSPVPALRTTPVATPEPAPAAKSSATSASAASASGDLREEIALLDQARAALRANQAPAALALLASYQKKYPRGEFRQEVTVLRVEALAKSGQLGLATALGRKFLAAHPESPHAERLERLLGVAH